MTVSSCIPRLLPSLATAAVADDHRGDQDPRVEDVLRRLRWISGIAFVGLIVFLAVFDSIVRAFFNNAFRVDATFLPALIGAVLTMLALVRPRK